MREDFFDALSGYFFDTPLSAHDAGDTDNFIFDSKDEAMKKAKEIGLTDVHSHETEDGETIWMPGKNMEEFQGWLKKHQSADSSLIIPEDEDYMDVGEPSEEATITGAYRYQNPKTGEVFTYTRKGIYRKDGTLLIYRGKASEYQGRKITLNKPFRTPDGPKKFAVYTKNASGTVVIVRFGDPDMEIKKDNPARRKSFRARHNCDSPGPKWKARYWSCKNW